MWHGSLFCYLYFELRRLETQVCLLCVNRLLCPVYPLLTVVAVLFFSAVREHFTIWLRNGSVMLSVSYIAPPLFFCSFATTTLLPFAYLPPQCKARLFRLSTFFHFPHVLLVASLSLLISFNIRCSHLSFFSFCLLFFYCLAISIAFICFSTRFDGYLSGRISLPFLHANIHTHTHIYNTCVCTRFSYFSTLFIQLPIS